MDIDEFLEQDILTYLDALLEESAARRPTIEPNAFLTRDYEKEFFTALDANNIVQAKRVLHDLKGKFDEAPSGTPEKDQLKTLLMTLYDKFKDHLDVEQSVSRIDSALAVPARAPQQVREAAVPQQPVQPSMVAPPPVQTPQQAAPRPLPAPVPVIDEHAVHVTQARELLATASALAEGGKAHEAAHTYRRARAEALGMDAVPDDLVKAFTDVHAKIKAATERERADRDRAGVAQRIDAVTAALDARDIQAAMRAFNEAKQAAQAAQLLPAFEGRLQGLRARIDAARAPLDKPLLLEIERQKTILDDALQRDDIAAAMRAYKAMRILAQQLTDPALAESVAKKMIAIYQILQRLRAHASERTLRRAVP